MKKDVAGLTSKGFWLLHRTGARATFNGKLSISYDGKEFVIKKRLTASYVVKDTLDFRPGKERSAEYNAWAKTVGAAYHKGLGARNAPLEVRWKKTMSTTTTKK